MLRYSLAVSGIGVVAGPLAADAPRPISTAERQSQSSRNKEKKRPMKKEGTERKSVECRGLIHTRKLLAVEGAWHARGARGRGCRRQHAQADACHLTAG